MAGAGWRGVHSTRLGAEPGEGRAAGLSLGSHPQAAAPGPPQAPQTLSSTSAPKEERGRAPRRASARNTPVPPLALTLWLYLGGETEPMQLRAEAAAWGGGTEGPRARNVPLAPLGRGSTVQPCPSAGPQLPGEQGRSGQPGRAGSRAPGSTAGQDTRPSHRLAPAVERAPGPGEPPRAAASPSRATAAGGRPPPGGERAAGGAGTAPTNAPVGLGCLAGRLLLPYALPGGSQRWPGDTELSQEGDRRWSDCHPCENAPPWDPRPQPPSTGQGQAEADPTAAFGQPPTRDPRNALPSCHPLMVPIKPKGSARTGPSPAGSLPAASVGCSQRPRAVAGRRKGIQEAAPQPYKQHLAPSTHQEGPCEGG